MRILIILLLTVVAQLANAQQIFIDRGVAVNGLWCFPTIDDTLAYRYLPDEAALTLNKDKHPEFSMIRYVALNESGTSANAIQQAGGGAIMNFLIEYKTPQNRIAMAGEELKTLLENDAVKIEGPIIFEKGNYALVSSILNKDGKKQNLMMASGSAPVLEGSKIALSFEMEPETSKLLLESFKMATPDISIVFDMTFKGLSEAFNAMMVVDWSQVQKHQNISASGKVYFVSAEVDLLFDELRKESAIKLTTSGEDAKMELLINRVYEKLTDLFFKQVEPKKTPPEVKDKIIDGISKVVKGLEEQIPYKLHGAYQLKELKTAGFARMDFNSRATVNRHHYITFNIGDLYKKYGDNKLFFRTVAMDDPDFQQREIYVGIDGTLQSELGKMINNVTVTLKKSHENGTETLKQIVITPELLRESALSLKMNYGSKEDADRMKWLQYEYRADWKFSGGGEYITNWSIEASSMISLFAPFRRTTVQLIGDTDLLETEGVKAAIVQVFYPFFAYKRSERLIWKPGDLPDDKTTEITLPLNIEAYNYKITWIKSDGSRLTKEGQDDTGLIFIDEIPE